MSGLRGVDELERHITQSLYSSARALAKNKETAVEFNKVRLAKLRTMAIFARRKLKEMFEDLRSSMAAETVASLSSRLNNSDTNTALAAEAELIVFWALNKEIDSDIEPDWLALDSRPDIYSMDAFNLPALIEITTISDDTFSGKKYMERTANIICQYAQRIQPSFKNKLHFEFLDESGYTDNKYWRKRCVDPSFKLDDHFKKVINKWLGTDNCPEKPIIRIKNEKTDVVISYRENVHPNSRTHSRMPAIAYDLEDNVIFKRLAKKSKQLKGAPVKTLKVIFLFDGGCDLLNRMVPLSPLYEVGASDIIEHFLNRNAHKLDFVCVLSPNKESYFTRILNFREDSSNWDLHIFKSKKAPQDAVPHKIKDIVSILPKPNYEGYQARSLHAQGVFSPDSQIETVGTQTTFSGAGNYMTIKMSARTLFNYLSGEVDFDGFTRDAFGSQKNVFAHQKSRGMQIKNVYLDGDDSNQDDDYVVFELSMIDWDII